jgi:hypothetical protein
MAVKFKSGDKVRFLNDIGGGIVNRVNDSGIVVVQTSDGFEIPVSSKELIPAGSFSIEDKDEPQEEIPVKNEVSSQKIKEAEKPAHKEVEKPAREEQKQLPGNVAQDAPVNMLLGFIPEEHGPVFSSELACYLINDSPYFAYYSLGTSEGGNFYHLSSGMIESETKNLISVFGQTALSKISAFHLQVIWLSKGRYFRKEPVDMMIDLHPVNFTKDSYYRENAFFDEKAILFQVEGKDDWVNPMGDPEVTERVKLQKTEADSSQPPQAKKREPASDTLEIDLHMDEQDLQKSQFSLSGILTLQMSRFHSALDEAISKRCRKLVIIHGVGQGTLKMQIRKELQEKHPEFLFQDASFREYGFGATMVHLIADKKQ